MVRDEDRLPHESEANQALLAMGWKRASNTAAGKPVNKWYFNAAPRGRRFNEGWQVRIHMQCRRKGGSAWFTATQIVKSGVSSHHPFSHKVPGVESECPAALAAELALLGDGCPATGADRLIQAHREQANKKTITDAYNRIK